MMKTVYDEKTQSVIDQAHKDIQYRAEYLVNRFNKKHESSVPTSTERMVGMQSINEDPVMKLLQKVLCDVFSTAIPSYIIEVDKAEIE